MLYEVPEQNSLSIPSSCCIPQSHFIKMVMDCIVSVLCTHYQFHAKENVILDKM